MGFKSLKDVCEIAIEQESRSGMSKCRTLSLLLLWARLDLSERTVISITKKHLSLLFMGKLSILKFSSVCNISAPLSSRLFLCLQLLRSFKISNLFSTLPHLSPAYCAFHFPYFKNCHSSMVLCIKYRRMVVMGFQISLQLLLGFSQMLSINEGIIWELIFLLYFAGLTLLMNCLRLQKWVIRNSVGTWENFLASVAD